MATKETAEEQVQNEEAVEEVKEEPKEEPKSEAAKSLTQEQVDEIVKNRVNRLNEKHAKEVEAVKAEMAEKLKDTESLQQELDQLKAEKEQAEWRKSAAKEFGLDADILRGSTEEEIQEHAKQIKDCMSTFKTNLGDNSHAHEDPAITNEKKFGEFMKKNFDD